jgi:N-acetylneuraminic acid mutarotase
LKNKNAPTGHVPKPRSAHASAVIGHKVYIFGGHAEAIEQQPCFGDFHVLNTSRKTWKRAKHHSHKTDFPVPRFGHSADAVGNKVYIFGGLDSTQTHCLNDLHVFDIVDRKWSRPEVHGAPPAPRAYHTTCVVGTKLFIFGGADKLRKFGDGYVFDTEENKWTTINFSSIPFLKRYFHTCYSYNNRVYLFAGESTEEDNHHFNDIYVMDSDSLEFGPEILATGAEPRGRSMHAVTQLTLDEHDYLVVFGGKGEDHFNDVTLLDLDSHKWYHCHIKGKQAMPRHAHTASTVGSKIYIFGGYGIKHRMNDVLILDFSNAKLKLSTSQDLETHEKDNKESKDAKHNE